MAMQGALESGSAVPGAAAAKGGATEPAQLQIQDRPILELFKGPPREPKQGATPATNVEKIVVASKQAAEQDDRRANYSTQEIVDKLREALQMVNRVIVGREDLIVQTMYALICREHQLIYSRAGLAKSLYAHTVFEQFSDASTFSVQLTKGTTEEGLVGAIDIEELKKGNIVHNTDGSMVEADLAFLDELFDANDPALRSLLGILNERSFKKGKQQVDAPLHTAIATSNYLRANDVTEAVIDRFPFRAVLLPDRNPLSMLEIDQSYEKGVRQDLGLKTEKKLSIDEIDYLADIVENKVADKRINANPAVLFLKNQIINRFVDAINIQRETEDKTPLYISPRTIAKTRDLINAAALIRGRDEVHVSDLKDLKYMICTIGDPENHEATFDKVFGDVTKEFSASDLKAVNFLIKARALSMQLIQKSEAGETLTPTFYQKVLMFFKLESMGHLTFAELLKVLEKVKAQHQEVKTLKESVVEQITREMHRLDGKDKSPLFC